MYLRGIVELSFSRLRNAPAASSLLALGLLFILTTHSSVAQEKPPPSPAPTPPVIADPDDGPLRVQTDIVTLTLTVHDKWTRYVSNLSKKHFRVFEDNVEQEIVFFSDVDAPASIGIVYDVSGSMSSGKIALSRRALERFMMTSHPSDEYSVIAFNDKVRLLADRTRDPNLVLGSLSNIKTGGNTALYDAVYLGIDRVSRGSHNKKAIIIISDGMDNNSRYSFSEMRRFMKEADVIIYAVGIGVEYEGYPVLRQLAEATGGKAFYGTDGSLDELFERIALELRNQYSIGYIPKDFQPDGKWRNLKVTVTPPRGMPRLSVRARKGYFATPALPNK